MRRITKKEYQQACSIDLYDFLEKHHSEKVRYQYGSLLLNEDKHISVKPGYHGYMNFRTAETGNNIDYLMRFLNYDFKSAVYALLGENAPVNEETDESKFHKDWRSSEKEINIPSPASGSYKNLYAYLMGRKISQETIKMLLDQNLMYQTEIGNNIVFLNPERDYCEIRGTNTYADQRCKRRDECDQFIKEEHGWCKKMNSCKSYKKDPFHGCRKKAPDRFWYFFSGNDTPKNKIYICEAAIDAISLYQIHKKKREWKPDSVYVSIGGVANQKAIDRIKKNSSKNQTLILAVDNDEAGHECRRRNPLLQTIIPEGKDWNDDLQKGEQ